MIAQTLIGLAFLGVAPNGQDAQNFGGVASIDTNFGEFKEHTLK